MKLVQNEKLYFVEYQNFCDLAKTLNLNINIYFDGYWHEIKDQ